MVKSEIMQLQEGEAREYAKALAAVARHYDVGASAKTLDWINLLTVVGPIYGLRLMMLAEMRKADQQGRPPMARPAAPMAPGAPGMAGNGHDPVAPGNDAFGLGIDLADIEFPTHVTGEPEKPH